MWALIRDGVHHHTRKAWVLVSFMWATESAGRVALHLLGRSRAVALDEWVFIAGHGMVAGLFLAGVLRRSTQLCAVSMMLASGVWMTWAVSSVITAQHSIPPGPLDGVLGSFVHFVIAVLCVPAWTRRASPHADRTYPHPGDRCSDRALDSLHVSHDGAPRLAPEDRPT